MSIYRIPNGLVISLIVAFYVHAALAGITLVKIMEHTAAGLVCLLALAFVGGAIGIGAGVVKLLSAGVLWLGHSQGLTFIILACVSSGLVALTWATIKRDSNVQVPMLPFAAASALIVVQFGDALTIIPF